MSQPLLYDIYSGQGGAGMGYAKAGFEVWGFDLNRKHGRHYAPGRFFMADALSLLMDLAEGVGMFPLPDAIHVSPPCQAYTNAQKIQGNEHPDLMARTRELLDEIDVPYVIENVPGAPMRADVTLCGTMFGLLVYRHRLFESNIPLAQPSHPVHISSVTKMGRPPQPGEFMHVVGNFSGVAQARKAMGIDWMTRDGLREAVPPAYTEYIGAQLIAALASERVA